MKIATNPIHVLLLIEIVQIEVGLIYGRVNNDNVARYLKLPRPLKYTKLPPVVTMQIEGDKRRQEVIDRNRSKKKGEREKVPSKVEVPTGLSSFIRNFWDETDYYSSTEFLLNKFVSSISFLGKFKTWSVFTETYRDKFDLGETSTLYLNRSKKFTKLQFKDLQDAVTLEVIRLQNLAILSGVFVDKIYEDVIHLKSTLGIRKAENGDMSNAYFLGKSGSEALSGLQITSNIFDFFNKIVYIVVDIRGRIFCDVSLSTCNEKELIELWKKWRGATMLLNFEPSKSDSLFAVFRGVENVQYLTLLLKNFYQTVSFVATSYPDFPKNIKVFTDLKNQAHLLNEVGFSKVVYKSMDSLLIKFNQMEYSSLLYKTDFKTLEKKYSFFHIDKTI